MSRSPSDPPYFHRVPVGGHESSDDARHRLALQVERHRRQREAAKARALAQRFPGITAATPIEPPFASWDAADTCPIHRFLLAEAGQATTQPTEADMIQHHHFHFDKGPPVMAVDPVLHTPTITIADRSGAEPIRFGVYGRDPEVVQRAVDAFNAVMDGATLLPVYPSKPDPAVAGTTIVGDAVESRRAAALASGLPQAGDRARAAEDTAALSRT